MAGSAVPNHPEEGPRRPAEGVDPLWRDVLGDCLRTLRHDRGETLSATATRAGVSPQYLSEMERGAKDASSEMVAAVAGALGVTLLDLTLAVADGLRVAAAPGGSSVGAATALALAA
jgi:transcriptional regulator with XRE-family HTH domain